jgi:hypothetical protein
VESRGTAEAISTQWRIQPTPLHPDASTHAHTKYRDAHWILKHRDLINDSLCLAHR